jgi:hypothetical protein
MSHVKFQCRCVNLWLRGLHLKPCQSQSHIYLLVELRDNTTSVVWRKNCPWWYMELVFFRNKTFLFVKIESWLFQHLFDLGFRETLQNFSSFRQTYRQHFSTGNKSCPNELTFWKVLQNKNHRYAENFRFLSWERKKFYS